MVQTSRAFNVNPAEAWPHFRIYQIELSSFCNLKCSYCPHPGMLRSKGHISEATLETALEWVSASGASQVALHHFGEPLLHPRLSDRLRQVAAHGLDMQISTNGVLLERAWDVLRDVSAQIKLMLSVHQWSDDPSKYRLALAAFQRRAEGTNLAILPAYNFDGSDYSFHSWAGGQDVDWDARGCPFVRYNAAVILWDGRIASCCVDHEGQTAVRNIVDADALSHRTRPWSACATCDVGRRMAGENWQ